MVICQYFKFVKKAAEIDLEVSFIICMGRPHLMKSSNFLLIGENYERAVIILVCHTSNYKQK